MTGVRTKTTRSNVEGIKRELATLPVHTLEELRSYIGGLLQVGRSKKGGTPNVEKR